ncbi:MAG: cytochrome P450 [Ketobacteraceae bacterium]|nr:cytochrome P450 [Ketobacteraceae bacterium]
MTSAAEIAAQLPKKANRRLSHIPGDYGLPVFGYTYEFFTDFPGLVKRKNQQYGDVFRYNALFQNVINLCGPDANEFVLKDADKNFSSKLAWDTVLEELFPNGLMLRDFDNHKYHRKILQAAFKKPAMQGYVHKMNPALAEGISRWPTHKQFSFFENIKGLLLSTGADLFLGIRMGKEADKVNKSFVAAVDASIAVMRLMIPGTTWYKGVKGRQYLEKFIGNLVTRKRSSNSDDFFAQLCHAEGESGEQLSDQEIIDHMIFLLFAAHDTTTSTLTSLVYRLARHPEWQETLREEMQAFDKDAVTYDDLQEMEKTSWVFKETLRMHPPLPTIPRRAVRDCEFKGYRIPKNATVGIHPVHTHFMEEYWTNPYRFDPERWSPERAEYKKHFYQFVPFGGGAHKCLGLNFAEIQSKVFLFQFLRRYRVGVKPGYEMKYQLVPLAMPKDGFPVTIEPV